MPDLKDIKGQETAKRALEVAAAGGHNLLMLLASNSGRLVETDAFLRCGWASMAFPQPSA